MKPVHYHDGRFPPSDLDWRRLVPFLGPASAAVARYDGILAAVPDPGILLVTLSTQEAVLSSRIEGTQATMGQVLEFQARGEARSRAHRDDVLEVLQYYRAMTHAVGMLSDLPLSQRVIRESHRILLSSGRGMQRSPGEYRSIQNWIGPPGCSVEDARFVPIASHNIRDALSTWEHYMHDTTQPDRLIQLAILHAEFESIHPFLDGNGRMGRMLIPLFMWQNKLIRQPVFYVSAYFEANRDAYYEGLLSVSRDNDWTGWCVLFLTAIRTQAEDNLMKAESILSLHDDMKVRVPEVTRSHFAIPILDWIFRKPVFSSSQFIKENNFSARTGRRILERLCDADVLRETDPGRGQRPALIVFPRLLAIADGGTET